MKRLCSVCARGGSKGVQNKNIRSLLGKPLLIHSLDQARQSGLFDCIVVSSDSKRNIPTLCGGVFITAAPDLAMTFPEINMIGIGEGERIVIDVADRIRRGISCHDSP